MSEVEKENRINSLAVTFLERQQIVPNLYADQIIRGYKEGYHQAEKDLDILSLVKEVSGVKEMSRAKEEALKAYPPKSIAANYDTIDRRDAFEYGYLKAEKDLELTWEDLALIRLAFDATEANINLGSLKISPMTKEYYEEVLKRFNKERKQQ